MFIAVFCRRNLFSIFAWKWMSSFGLTVVCQLFLTQPFYSQQFNQQTYSATYQQNNNYLRNSQVFRQEIARFQITVAREGKEPLPITQVPRVQQGDVLKVKLLDEQVGGLKLDQTMWDWTFLVTFINPLRRMNASIEGNSLVDGKKSKSAPVSEEIQFRKTGWYREYSFTVPYDSQPVFFLYPRPKYRQQMIKVVSRKYEDLRKLGEID